MREGIQRVLEQNRRFDYDYIPFGDTWVIPDERTAYRPDLFGRIAGGFFRTVECLFGPLIIQLVYGAKLVGRENLKALGGKGAITVCNHFSFLDTLFLRHAVGHYRSYCTAAPWNNKRGLAGWFLRVSGVLPFSPNLIATRNLWQEMERLLSDGKYINFYPEQAMWVNYRKPRPMKEGAFRFAVKYGVPVLPVFCTFDKGRRGNIRRMRIHILPAIYADESLPKGARAQRMLEQAQESWRTCYERAYGIPLTYLDDVRKNPHRRK